MQTNGGSSSSRSGRGSGVGPPPRTTSIASGHLAAPTFLPSPSPSSAALDDPFHTVDALAFGQHFLASPPALSDAPAASRGGNSGTISPPQHLFSPLHTPTPQSATPLLAGTNSSGVVPSPSPATWGTTTSPNPAWPSWPYPSQPQYQHQHHPTGLLAPPSHQPSTHPNSNGTNFALASPMASASPTDMPGLEFGSGRTPQFLSSSASPPLSLPHPLTSFPSDGSGSGTTGSMSSSASNGRETYCYADSTTFAHVSPSATTQQAHSPEQPHARGIKRERRQPGPVSVGGLSVHPHQQQAPAPIESPPPTSSPLSPHSNTRLAHKRARHTNGGSGPSADVWPTSDPTATRRLVRQTNTASEGSGAGSSTSISAQVSPLIASMARLSSSRRGMSQDSTSTPVLSRASTSGTGSATTTPTNRKRASLPPTVKRETSIESVTGRDGATSPLPPGRVCAPLPIPTDGVLTGSGNGLAAGVTIPKAVPGKRGGGFSCHCCKTSKRNIEELFLCTNVLPKLAPGNNGTGAKTISCKKKYCIACMKRLYPPEMQLLRGRAQDQWTCPSCLNRCTCAGCERKVAGQSEAPWRHKKGLSSANSGKKKAAASSASHARNSHSQHHRANSDADSDFTHSPATSRAPSQVRHQRAHSHSSPSTLQRPRRAVKVKTYNDDNAVEDDEDEDEEEEEEEEAPQAGEAEEGNEDEEGVDPPHERMAMVTEHTYARTHAHAYAREDEVIERKDSTQQDTRRRAAGRISTAPVPSDDDGMDGTFQLPTTPAGVDTTNASLYPSYSTHPHAQQQQKSLSYVQAIGSPMQLRGGGPPAYYASQPSYHPQAPYHSQSPHLHQQPLPQHYTRPTVSYPAPHPYAPLSYAPSTRGMPPTGSLVPSPSLAHSHPHSQARLRSDGSHTSFGSTTANELDLSRSLKPDAAGDLIVDNAGSVSILTVDLPPPSVVTGNSHEPSGTGTGGDIEALLLAKHRELREQERVTKILLAQVQQQKAANAHAHAQYNRQRRASLSNATSGPPPPAGTHVAYSHPTTQAPS